MITVGYVNVNHVAKSVRDITKRFLGCDIDSVDIGLPHHMKITIRDNKFKWYRFYTVGGIDTNAVIESDYTGEPLIEERSEVLEKNKYIIKVQKDDKTKNIIMKMFHEDINQLVKKLEEEWDKSLELEQYQRHTIMGGIRISVQSISKF